LTSPPYYDIKNYENSECQIGYKQNYESYLSDIVNVFQQYYNVANDKATFWVVIDTMRKNGVTKLLPFDITNKLIEFHKNNTWILRDIIIWNKLKNLPWHSKGKLKNQFE